VVECTQKEYYLTMSYFAVTIEEISEIRPHSNADRLQVASIKGIDYQFIVGKDLWRVGDKCLYFPLDAVMPEKILIAFNLVGKLAGAQRNRVKTIKLRGEISQGLIGPLSLISELPSEKHTPEEITSFLGVTKYEPEIEIPTGHDARLIDLPEGVGIYDIENSERYKEAVAELMDAPCWISEKLEGSHFAISVIDGVATICQRRFAIEPIPEKPEHFFWETAREEGLIELAKKLALKINAQHFIMRGEIIGPNVQSNIYRLHKRTVKFFDILVEHRYIPATDLLALFKAEGREDSLVPTLSISKTLKEWLNGKTLKEASTGNSALHATLREGIVIRPIPDRSNKEIEGRLILKQISPEYLAQ